MIILNESALLWTSSPSLFSTFPISMPDQNRVVSPGPNESVVRLPDGSLLPVPQGWEVLLPGDAALTRRVKAAGPTWVIEQRKGRKVFRLGLWAPMDRILQIRDALDRERATPAYAKRQVASAARREKKQTAYVADFEEAVSQFLDFHACHEEIARKLAKAVSEHATPVGSGTVARTERIPIEQRAEAAVIAWMRHQTTGYDIMRIARVKGKRREVRRILAQHSRKLLDKYRSGAAVDAANCPLQQALVSDYLDRLADLAAAEDEFQV